MVFVRVYSGILRASSKVALYNPNKKIQKRFTKFLKMHANVPQEIQSVS